MQISRTPRARESNISGKGCWGRPRKSSKCATCVKGKICGKSLRRSAKLSKYSQPVLQVPITRETRATHDYPEMRKSWANHESWPKTHSLTWVSTFQRKGETPQPNSPVQSVSNAAQCHQERHFPDPWLKMQVIHSKTWETNIIIRTPRRDDSWL